MTAATGFNPPSLLTRLDNQTALITGAGSGLGWRFAETLAAAGAKVILCGRREERLQALARQINARGEQAIVQVMDVQQADSLPAIIEQLTREHGPIRILVNNAGVGHTQPALHTSLEDLDALYGTNLRGPFILAREVARQLIDQKLSGRIVNLASVGAFHYSPGMHAVFYCALKAAIVRLSEALAMEWAKHRINVNAIAPGLFESEMTEQHLGQFGEQMLARLPRKRAGIPTQLDSSLLYLVSEASEFVTGICLRIDDAQYPR